MGGTVSEKAQRGKQEMDVVAGVSPTRAGAGRPERIGA
jgi:hypothetical protein